LTELRLQASPGANLFEYCEGLPGEQAAAAILAE
jgi:hypothetical protein